MPGYTVCSQAPSAPSQWAFACLQTTEANDTRAEVLLCPGTSWLWPRWLLVSLMPQGWYNWLAQPIFLQWPRPRVWFVLRKGQTLYVGTAQSWQPTRWLPWEIQVCLYESALEILHFGLASCWLGFFFFFFSCVFVTWECCTALKTYQCIATSYEGIKFHH